LARRGAAQRGSINGGMIRALIVLAIVVLLAIIGGWLYLAYGNFPVSPTPVEKVLPDARFPK
jgi:hypothetical protein